MAILLFFAAAKERYFFTSWDAAGLAWDPSWLKSIRLYRLLRWPSSDNFRQPHSAIHNSGRFVSLLITTQKLLLVCLTFLLLISLQFLSIFTVLYIPVRSVRPATRCALFIYINNSRFTVLGILREQRIFSHNLSNVFFLLTKYGICYMIYG